MASGIDTYLNSELPFFLKKYDLPEFVISKIKEDIHFKMNSLFVHWSDLNFRRAILSIGLEEATFYEPKGNLELKCFVVATNRNSLFENLVSTKTAAKSLGLEEAPIPESDVKEFTKLAISCLKEVNFDEDLVNLSTNSKVNLYSELPEKYPVAWRALSELGKWSNKGQSYEGVNLGALELPELMSGISVRSKASPDYIRACVYPRLD